MKASELLEKTKPLPAENEPGRYPSQEEKVNEAYENISKKLEALRTGPEPADESTRVTASQPQKSQEPKEPEDQDIIEPDRPDESDDELDEPDELEKPNDNTSDDSPPDAGQESSDREDTLDDLAREELHIPNLHSPKPALNFHYRERGSQVEKKSSRHILILGLVGLGVISAAVYLLKNQPSGSKTMSPSPSTTVAVMVTPAPTPTLTLSPQDRSKFKVRVLNGTTKTGLAASVSAKLKDLGYQTGKTGNATNSAFAQTLIRVKVSAQVLADQLIKDLAGQFDAASSSAALKDSDTVDGEVILGTR